MQNTLEKVNNWKNKAQLNKVQLSLKNYRTLKLIPRIVAQQVVYKISSELNNQINQENQSPFPLQDQELNSEMSNEQNLNRNLPRFQYDSLPHCQDIGAFLNIQKNTNLQQAYIQNILKRQNSFQESEFSQISQPKVVVIAVRIRNFYDEIGVNQARRFFDEQAEIERQVDLSDKFLQIASDVIYKCNGADLIQFFGDSLVACFQGQSDQSAAQIQVQKQNILYKKNSKLINIEEQNNIPDDTDQLESNQQFGSFIQQQEKSKKVKFDQEMSQDNSPSESQEQSDESEEQEDEQVTQYTDENEQYDYETYCNLKTALYSANKIYHLVQNLLDSMQNKQQKTDKPNQSKQAQQEPDEKKQDKEVQIGIGYGECSMYHVGGVFGRTAFFSAGKALQEAQDCLRFARSSNYQGIIASQSIWRSYQLMQNHNQNDEVRFFKTRSQIPNNYVQIDLDNFETLENYESVEKNKNSKIQKFFTYFQNDIIKIDITQREKIWPELLKYIPMYFRPFLETPKTDQSLLWQKDLKQGNHMRILTIMALSLEIDGMFQNDESLKVLQESIEIIQTQIYRMRGSLSRISYQSASFGLSDLNGFEGGIQIEAEWGQPGLPNDDNPSRACICALNIQKALKDFIFKPKLNQGSEDGSLQNSVANDEDSQSNSP